ncbi:hypothetical protein [Candidatus Enterovibrio escicola]|uniref:hypothetical protein n=1 Tax=Candidatus Enterovibrio escicola TaxID=1927127 RepID=UPI001237A94A|nr:hypothetical protein [Candidatus Enterovibrio escacola]
MGIIMKFRSFAIAATSMLGLLVSSFNAQAGFMSWNGNTIEALDLNGDFTSFEEFYDYDNAFQWSSNTGLEEADTIVMFLAELGGELAIFSTISSPQGGSKGQVGFDYTASAGSMLFLDDPDESVNSAGINFKYGSNKSDGFIYGGLGNFDWSFVPSFFNASNVDGIKFVSFSDGEFSSASYSSLFSLDEPLVVSNLQLGSGNVSNAVSAPGTILLMVLGFTSLLISRKRLKF